MVSYTKWKLLKPFMEIRDDSPDWTENRVRVPRQAASVAGGKYSAAAWILACDRPRVHPSGRGLSYLHSLGGLRQFFPMRNPSFLPLECYGCWMIVWGLVRKHQPPFICYASKYINMLWCWFNRPVIWYVIKYSRHFSLTLCNYMIFLNVGSKSLFWVQSWPTKFPRASSPAWSAGTSAAIVGSGFLFLVPNHGVRLAPSVCDVEVLGWLMSKKIWNKKRNKLYGWGANPTLPPDCLGVGPK